MSSIPVKNSLAPPATRRIPRGASARLQWKEFRQNVPLLIVFVALMAVTLTLAAGDRYFGLRPEQDAVAYTVICMLCGFFSLTIGVFLFSPEKEAKTIRQMTHLPITSGFVVRHKLLNGLFLIVCFILIGVLFQLIEIFAFNTTIQIPPEYFNVPSMILIGLAIVLIPLECFFWGSLCSLAINRTIYAAIVATGCCVLFGWMLPVFASAWFYDPYQFSILATTFFIGTKLLLAALGCLLFVRYGNDWLGNSPQLSRASSLPHEAGFSLSGFRNSKFSNPFSRRIYSQGRIYRSLVWQSLRQFQWSFLIAIGVGLPLFVLGLLNLVSAGPPGVFSRFAFLAMTGAVMITWLGALFTFRGDHRDESYKFFQQHVEHGKKFWLSRIFPVAVLAGFSIMLIVTIVFVIASSPAEFPLHEQAFRVCVTMILVVLTAFGVGQFCSLQFRSSVFALAAFMISSVVTMSWITWISALGSSPWFYVGPFVLSLFVVTWWRAPRWLAGKNRITDLVIPMILAGMVAATMLSLFTYQRYSEYQSVQFSLADQIAVYDNVASQPQESESSTQLIRDAAQQVALTADDGGIRNFRMPINRAAGEEIPKEVNSDAAISKFLESNQATIQLIERALSQANQCISLDPRSIASRSEPVERIRFLLATAGIHSESKDDLESALRFWTLLLKFDEACPGYSTVTDSAVSYLSFWSELENQTPELLTKAIGALKISKKKWNQIAEASTLLDELDFENWYEQFSKDHNPNVQDLRFKLNFAPAMPSVLPTREAERSRRIVHETFQINRRIFETSSELVSDPSISFSRDWGSYFPYSLWHCLGVRNEFQFTGGFDPNKREYFRAQGIADDQAVNQVLVDVQCRRHTQVKMALIAWRLENGSYPESLDKLVPKYFSSLPVCVYYGKPFAYSQTGIENIAIWGNSTSGVKANTPFLLPWSQRSNVARIPEAGMFDSAQYENYSDDSSYVCLNNFGFGYTLPSPKSTESDPEQ